MMPAANDDEAAVPLMCPCCERTGWLGERGRRLETSPGFEIVDGTPTCASCDEPAGMRLAMIERLAVR